MRRADRQMRERIFARMDQLSEDPFDRRISKALVNAGGMRSSRLGQVRMLYTVDQGFIGILVVDIGQRGQVYRRI